jgi:fumarate hydratase, class II
MMPVMAQAFLESAASWPNAAPGLHLPVRPGDHRQRIPGPGAPGKNPAIATALNLHIGYDVASEVAKQAAKEGRSVRDVVLERGLLTRTGSTRPWMSGT